MFLSPLLHHSPMHLAVPAPWKYPLHPCLSPTPQCSHSPAVLGTFPIPLPADASASPSSQQALVAVGPHQCYVTGLRQPSPVASRALGEAEPPKPCASPMGRACLGGGPEQPYHIRCLSLQPGPEDKLSGLWGSGSFLLLFSSFADRGRGKFSSF